MRSSTRCCGCNPDVPGVRFNRPLADHDGFRYNGFMVELITASDAATLLGNHDVDVIDVREEHEWLTGHLERARLVPLDQFRADPEKVLRRDVPTVFVCAKGVRSLTAAKLAERLGYTRLYNLVGGTIEWARAGLPLVVAERVAA